MNIKTIRTTKQRITIAIFIAIVICFGLFYLKNLYYSLYMYPIDIVYTWVDGSDKDWLAKKNYWQKKYNIFNPYSTSEARFRQREDLLHSLRSIDENMPWVRNIYIITDGQTPSWLDTNNKKIKIIDHKSILPNKALPVFNSMAIETGIANIPHLSEHFIYSNDDCFVNKPLTPDFFFDKKGKPIFYYDKEWNKFYFSALEKEKNSTFAQNALNSFELYKIKKHLQTPQMYYAVDNHNMSSYSKKAFLKVLEQFGDELNYTTYSKFREDKDISIFTLIMLEEYTSNNLTIKQSYNVTQYNCRKSGIYVVNHINKLENNDYCLFCLNDSPILTKDIHTPYLRKRFPNKSHFEK